MYVEIYTYIHICIYIEEYVCMGLGAIISLRVHVLNNCLGFEV